MNTLQVLSIIGIGGIILAGIGFVGIFIAYGIERLHVKPYNDSSIKVLQEILKMIYICLTVFDLSATLICVVIFPDPFKFIALAAGITGLITIIILKNNLSNKYRRF